MHDFVYNNPVKIIFGKNALAQTGSEAAIYGKTALLVYGRSSLKSNNILPLIIDILDRSGIRIVEHQGVFPNPVLSFVHEGIKKVRSENCSIVIGAGGGSVMDTAKAIASGVPVSHDVWKFFTGKKTVIDALPVLTIPTCAGTGSEVNSGMVLTHDQKKLKLGFAHRRLFPRVCIADPTLSSTVEDSQSAYGAIDTFAHCLEPYLSGSPPHPPLQFRQLEAVMKTVIETIVKMRKYPQSYENRATLLWCGSVAMSGICTAGVGRVGFPLHMIEHAISASGDIAHGAGLSALLPGWLLSVRDILADRLSNLGTSVFADAVTDSPLSAVDTVRKIIDLLDSINCPVCLDDIGIKRGDFPGIIDHCLFQARIWRIRDYNEERLLSLLHSCLHRPSLALT